MIEKQEANVPLLVTIGAAGVILLVVIIVGLQAVFLRTEQNELAQYNDAPVIWLTNLRLQQQTKLHSYRWVDQSKQIVAIPIDEAMKLYVENGGHWPATQPAVTRHDGKNAEKGQG
jgi:Tfp pilus assembly protein PilV